MQVSTACSYARLTSGSSITKQLITFSASRPVEVRITWNVATRRLNCAFSRLSTSAASSTRTNAPSRVSVQLDTLYSSAAAVSTQPMQCVRSIRLQ